MAKVADVMDAGINFVSPSTPVIEVAHQMRISGKRAIAVCENGKFQGVVTEKDIINSIVAAARDPVSEPASLIMNNRYPSISPGDDIAEAAKLMVNNAVWMLPVVQKGKLRGLFTLEDLAMESEALAAFVFSKTVKRLMLREKTNKAPASATS